jgi:hypothetical protein
MPSKKELMKEIEELKARLTYLENMHARFERIDDSPWTYSPLGRVAHEYDGFIGTYNNRSLTSNEVREARCDPHPYTRERTAQTRKITGITLQELAQFVIDKKPIKREFYKSDRYETAYRADGITKSVHTGLGNISIEEGSW